MQKKLQATQRPQCLQRALAWALPSHHRRVEKPVESTELSTKSSGGKKRGVEGDVISPQKKHTSWWFQCFLFSHLFGADFQLD